jgi:molecular chaperone GrpE
MTDKHRKKTQQADFNEETGQGSEQPENGVPTEALEDQPETVTLPLKDYAGHLEELDDLRQKADEFSDGWQRERAEFANYRKRVARDEQMQRENVRIDVIRKYLDVHDDLELAIKNMPPAVRNDSWTDGIELIYQKLLNILAGESIQPIPAENAAFDPDLHEAISHEENDEVESGHVIEVVQKGYTIGDRVIRPARVRVAK